MTNGTAKRGMTAADLFKLQLVSDAQISPDGTQVAFVVTHMDEADDAYHSAIWLVPAAGGEPRRFTRGKKRDLSPRWSPDGRRLAFVSEREGDKHPQLYVMEAGGGEPFRLSELKAAAGEPVWSPDGSRIAFTSRVKAEQDEDDEKKDKDAGGEKDGEGKKSKPARVITSLRYKSNGEGFIYDRRRHIFVVKVPAGAALGSETPAPVQITDGDWNDGAASWSPDGSQIVFSSARHEERDYDQVSDLWIVGAEGGEPRRITPGRGPCGYPAWSPDGKLIAYTGNEYALDMGRNDRVFVIAPEGGEPRCLTASLDRTCTPFAGAIGPAWSPDGRTIYFGIEDRGMVPIYRVQAAGGDAPEEAVGSAERQLTCLSIANDGTIAFCASSTDSPAEVYVQRPGAREQALTSLNAAFKAETELVRPDHFTFERAGYTLDCWVMRPAGYREGKRYPVILNVHGGPATQYGYNFFDEFQVQTGAGYAVVFTNPRGSQGYGEEFTRAVKSDWGGGDYQDVMRALDEALARYNFLDRERMGVQGGSYGGFMTSWTVGHTDRFKAACSERAVNNLYTLFGTSDIGSSFSEIHAGFKPWENMQWYIDHSPLTYAANMTTPLLILHSEDDLRCPIEQAEQLFVALKKMRKEVLFVRFPAESHEMSRSGKPHHRRDRFGFILDWMNDHLQPATAKEQQRQPAAAAAGD